MQDFNSRLARLEERVFNAQADQLETFASDLKALTNKLNWLIVVLAGNFGISFLKLLPMIQ